MKQILYAFLLILSTVASPAQTATGKVIDAQSSESIPYANIIINNSEALVSNGEGVFTIPSGHADGAMVTVSFMGYQSFCGYVC